MDVIRQGDVWLVPIREGECIGCAFSARLTPEPVAGDVVLALGEATGHAHRIRAPHSVLMAGEGGNRVMTVEAPAPLTHEEHGTHVVPPGEFHVHIQRVHDCLAEAARQVVD